MPMFGPRQFVQVDARGLKKFAQDLATFRQKAVPHAARNALTSIAFEARGEWGDEMRRKFQLRNTWTQRSPRVVPARGVSLPAMFSQVGSELAYLAQQEAGFTSQAHGKHGLPKPVPFAAGQAMGTRLRTRVVQRQNRMASIRLDPPKVANRSGGRRQRNAVAIRLAAKSGSRYVFLDLGKRKGIFRIMGTRRLRPRLVWDLSERTMTTPAHATLGPAVARVGPRIPGFYATAIVAEFRRARIFHFGKLIP